jgi:beta-phosphoglucomutase-like phosphatase (HAD superfamily)
MTLQQFYNNLAHYVKPESIFIFDMDGTLVNSDIANFNAYSEALSPTINLAQRYIAGRITRASLSELGVSRNMQESVISQKREIYNKYLKDTIKMPLACKILEIVSKTNMTILATQSEKQRAIDTLHYHNLLANFTHSVFREDLQEEQQNKYAHVVQKYNLNPQDVFVLEDNEIEIANALTAGIPQKNIISLLKPHVILPNHFLKRKTQAYYHIDYVGHLQPFNPDFINILKNQDGSTNSEKLYHAQAELKDILLNDIAQIYSTAGVSPLTICVIPRAKAETEYQPQQLLFRTTIKEVVEYLTKKYSYFLEDGTNYIIRHTNTRTTHLQDHDTDGEKPYPRITCETCTISENVYGKSILLIDDIYTSNVNIDEDAIQALYDNGARKVLLYTIAKTKH